MLLAGLVVSLFACFRGSVLPAGLVFLFLCFSCLCFWPGCLFVCSFFSVVVVVPCLCCPAGWSHLLRARVDALGALAQEILTFGWRCQVCPLVYVVVRLRPPWPCFCFRFFWCGLLSVSLAGGRRRRRRLGCCLRCRCCRLCCLCLAVVAPIITYEYGLRLRVKLYLPGVVGYGVKLYPSLASLFLFFACLLLFGARVRVVGL